MSVNLFPLRPHLLLLLLVPLVLCAFANGAWAQAAPSPAKTGELFNITINSGPAGGAANSSVGLSTTLQILMLFTVLTLAPSIIIMTTCFVRIIIVLSFLRNALTLQVPPNQVVIGLALFMTFYIMEPTFTRIMNESVIPLRDNKITFEQGIDKAILPLKDFMLRYVTEEDLRLFLSMSSTPIELTAPEDLPIHIIVPSFMLSELKKGFQMGLLILLPFLVIDMVVASILMALGMMMLPPPTVALPIKLMVFVVVDGWTLIVQSLVDSFKV